MQLEEKEMDMMTLIQSRDVRGFLFGTMAAVALPSGVWASDPLDGTVAVGGAAELTEAQLNIESDAADRIVLASKLRTLTQQVAAASCSITSRVDSSAFWSSRAA